METGKSKRRDMFVGTMVEAEVFDAFAERAEAEGLAPDELLRKILSGGDYHPAGDQ